ncbi:hypothetical protein Tco_0060741 [Tanacetum coccineum]
MDLNFSAFSGLLAGTICHQNESETKRHLRGAQVSVWRYASDLKANIMGESQWRIGGDGVIRVSLYTHSDMDVTSQRRRYNESISY